MSLTRMGSSGPALDHATFNCRLLKAYVSNHYITPALQITVDPAPIKSFHLIEECGMIKEDVRESGMLRSGSSVQVPKKKSVKLAPAKFC